MQTLRDDEQLLELSPTGGTVMRWRFRDVDIFFPRQTMHIDGADYVRGGMHVCFPNFDEVAPAFGLPRHGTIRNREADEVTDGSFLFRGRDLLGVGHDELCEVKVSASLEPKGFSYTLAARLLEPAKSPVWMNAGMHPYFSTPQGDATIELPSGQDIYIGGPQISMRYEDFDHEVVVSLPGIGGVQVDMRGNAWETGAPHKVALWRDAVDYICVEPVMQSALMYGATGCFELSETWSAISCRFQMLVA